HQVTFAAKVLYGGIYKNASHPSFERALTAKTIQFFKDLDKSFLQDIFSFFCITCIAKTNGIHPGGKAAIQFLLHTSVAFHAPINKVAVGEILVASWCQNQWFVYKLFKNATSFSTAFFLWLNWFFSCMVISAKVLAAPAGIKTGS